MSVTIDKTNQPVACTEGEVTSEGVIAALADAGLTLVEIERVRKGWLIAEREIDAFKATHGDPEAEYRIAVIASGAEACLLHRGKPSTPAILDATPEQLLSYIDYYERECAELHAELTRLAGKLDNPSDSPQWLKTRHKFERLAGFLWECKTQSGIGAVLLAGVAF